MVRRKPDVLKIKLPRLYLKLMDLISKTSMQRRTNSRRVEREVCQRFRLDLDDVKATTREMEEWNLLATRRGRRGRAIDILVRP